MTRMAARLGYWRRKIRGRGFVLVVLALGMAAGASADETGGWIKLPGQIVDVAINDAAQAYAVSQTGGALRWRSGDQRWSKMSGNFVRITGAEGNRPWAVDGKGNVHRFNGLWWEPKGDGVADVAGDAVGNIFIAGTDGRIQKWEPLSGDWKTVAGRAARIALDERGEPWVIAPDGRIYRRFNGQWLSMPGSAQDIAVGADGTAIIADAEGHVRRWHRESSSWVEISGLADVVAVAAAPGGGAWAVRRDGTLHGTVLIKSEDVLAEVPDQAAQVQAAEPQAPGISAPTIVAPTIQANSASASVAKPSAEQAADVSAPQAKASSVSPSGGGESGSNPSASKSVSPSRGGGSGDPAATTTNADIVFADTRETAASVEIGKDGSVFVLIAGGSIKRWSNKRQRLEDFPGELARLAVDGGGAPWGVTSLGRVFRHNGQTWKQIAGATASDIAIGADGSVVTADSESVLRKFNPVTGRFDRIDGRGIQVAVAPDGTPWTIRDDAVVQRCDKPICTPVNRLARNISIGPDGSVFIVTAQGQLQRRRPGKDTFETVLTPGYTPADVGVGPNGFPWVVATDGTLLSSKYFERDESADRTLALRTSPDTAGVGATTAVVSTQSSSGFTFTKNMSFDTYSSGQASLSEIFVGQDGTAFSTDGSDVLKFSKRTEKFETMETKFPSSVDSISTDADGVYWGLDSTTTKVYRIKGTQVKTYTVSGASGNTPRNLAVTGGGDVYAVFGAAIWLKKATDSTFKEQTQYGDEDVYNIAIAGAGDIWILNQSFKIQQWTGSKFEDRPKGTAQGASQIAAGADGTVYVLNNNKLLRWNATNAAFDEVNPTNISASFVSLAVAPDGRPWAADSSGGTGTKDVFEARD